MIHLIGKYAKVSLVSLVVLAISLPIFAMAAVAPTVTALPVIKSAGTLPNSLAIAPDGSIYVGNYSGGAINQLDPTGKFVRTVNSERIYSHAIAFSQDGTLLAVTNQSVLRVAPDGMVVGALPVVFQGARSITVDDLGYIYVVDTVACEIVVFSPNYQFVKRFASKGTALGQLQGPAHIVFDKVSRQLLVADMLNNRIQFFDLNGNPVKSFGGPAAAMGRAILPMEFQAPQAVAIEYTKVAPYQMSRLYVVDSFQNLLQVVDPVTSSPILFPGTTNNFITSNILNQIATPSYAAFDQINGRLLVTSTGGVTVFGIDGGGNPADTTPPAVTVDPVQGTVFVPTVTLTGTVEADSFVLVSAPSAVVGQVQMPTPTTWKVVVSSLVAGSNTISVSAKDAAGNVASSKPVNVSYILPAPVLSVSTLPSITNIGLQTLVGTVDAGAIVKVKNSATQVEGSAVVNGSVWTYTAVLAEGVNTLTISANTANSQTSIKEVSVVLDAISPKLTVSALSNGSVTSEAVQNITGTIADAGQVSVVVNSVPVDVIDGVFSTAVTLVDGQNQVTVVASDVAGNTVQDQRTLVYDGTKPVITIASTTLPDNATTNSPVYTISGSVSESSQVTVAGSQVTLDSSNNWSSVVNLVEGVTTIEVAATDYAGNISSVKRTVTYSPEKINLAIITPAQDFAPKTKHVNFSGTVSSSSQVTLSYTVNNGKPVAIHSRNGKYSFEVDFKKAGTYSVAVTAKDASGLSTTVVRTLVYDKKSNRGGESH